MTDLTMLHVSSNQLERLPDSIVECTSLEFVYANSNKLRTIPNGMASALVLLQRLTLSHNSIHKLSQDFVQRFGEPRDQCDLDPTCVVTLACNPIVTKNDSQKDVTPMKE